MGRDKARGDVDAIVSPQAGAEPEDRGKVHTGCAVQMNSPVCRRNRFRMYHLTPTLHGAVLACAEPAVQSVGVQPMPADWVLMVITTIPCCRVRPGALVEVLEDVARERVMRDWTTEHFPRHSRSSNWEPLKRTAREMGFISTPGNSPTELLVAYCDADPGGRRALLADALVAMCAPAFGFGPNASLEDLYSLMGDLGSISKDKMRLFIVGMADYVGLEAPVAWRSPMKSSRRPHARGDVADVTDAGMRRRRDRGVAAGPPLVERQAAAARPRTGFTEFDVLLKLLDKQIGWLPESRSEWSPCLLPVLEMLTEYVLEHREDDAKP